MWEAYASPLQLSVLLLAPTASPMLTLPVGRILPPRAVLIILVTSLSNSTLKNDMIRLNSFVVTYLKYLKSFLYMLEFVSHSLEPSKSFNHSLRCYLCIQIARGDLFILIEYLLLHNDIHVGCASYNCNTWLETKFRQQYQPFSRENVSFGQLDFN